MPRVFDHIHKHRKAIRKVLVKSHRHVVRISKNVSNWMLVKVLVSRLFHPIKAFEYVTVVVLALCIFIYASVSGNPLVEHLYATSCLGSWQNTHLAQGKPEVTDGEGFNEENSAVLKNSLAELFCGGFQGEIPEDTAPERAYVVFSWGSTLLKNIQDNGAAGAGTGTGDASSSTDQVMYIKGSDASSTDDLIDSTNATDTIIIKPEEPAPASSSDTSASVETKTDEQPKTETDTTAAPQTETTPAPESAPAPTPVPDPAPAPAPTQAASPDLSFFAKKVYADGGEIPADTLLEIKYTLNGTDWQVLGHVGLDSLKNTNRFELPKEIVSNWKTFSQLQISVASVPDLNGESVVYIDSAWIEVEYNKIKKLSEEEISNLPRVEVNEDAVFTSPKEGFSSKEDAEFEIQLEDTPVVTPSVSSTTPTQSQVDTASSSADSSASPPATVEQSTSSVDSHLETAITKLFSFFLQKRAYAADVSKKRILKAELIGPDGKKYKDQPFIDQSGATGKITIPNKGRSFRPGLYKLNVEVLTDDKILVTTKDFGWGVLAINVDQSSYSANENVFLQIGSLTSEGHTICNAHLQLEIDNNGNKVTLSTSDGSIKNSTECGKDNVTDKPDYYANYVPKVAGTYSMTLTNLDNGFVINDSFVVKSGAPFIVERVGATRINPFASSYSMKVIVHAHKDFKGQVVEELPSGFALLSSALPARVITTSDALYVNWDVDMSAGETKTIQYEYQAPPFSPELFLLGSVKLQADGVTMFDEGRSWQLASDAACNAISSGNWNDGTKFSGCSGPGGIPDATDDVTVNNGVSMQVIASTTINSLTMAQNTSSTSSNAVILNTGVVMNVNGAITMAAALAGGTSVAVGTATLNAGSVAIAGSATSSAASSLSMTTGRISVAGSITFSGTAAQARVISTGASTLSVGVNFSAGGTLTTSNTGTIIFNGTSTQTMAAYATYNHVEVNGVGNNVTAAAATINGSLTVTSGTMTMPGVVVTVTGTTTVSGTLALTSATGAKTFVGPVIVNNGGTWSETAAAIPTFRNGITNNGTFTASTGVHTFNTNSQQLNGGAISIPSATITGVTLTSNVNFTVGTALAGTGGLTMASNTTLNIGGTSAITTLTANGSGVVTNYNGTAAQTVKSTTYSTLKINNTNASGASLTTGGATTTTLTIGDVASTSIFADAGLPMRPVGTSVLNIYGNYKLGSASVATALPSFSTININTGSTIEYAAGVAQTINPNLAYYNLTVSGATSKTITGALNLAGTLTLNASAQTLDLGNFSHSLTNIVITAGTLNASTSVISFSGTMSGAGAFNGNLSTFNFVNGTLQAAAATTLNFYNLGILNGSSWQTTSNATVTNQLLIATSSGLTVGAFNFTVPFSSATTTINGSLAFLSTTGTKTFAAPLYFGSASGLNNSINEGVTIQNDVTVMSGANFTTGTGVYLFDTRNIGLYGDGTFALSNVTINGITVTNYMTGRVSALTTLSGTGNWMQTATSYLNIGGTSLITGFDASSTGNTVSYTGAGAQTVRAVPYYNLRLEGGGTKTLTNVSTINGDFVLLGGSGTTATGLTVGGDLTVGTLINSSTLTVAGFDFTVNGTTTISGSGVLAHSSASGTKTYKGEVTLSSGSWTNAGNSAINYQGGLTVNGGTFTSGTGAYSFNTNNQNVGGSAAFTIANVTVPSGITLTNTSTVGLSVSTALTGSGTLTQAANAILNIAASDANFSLSTLDTSASDNVVNYNGTVLQNIRSQSYQTLKVNNTNAGGAVLPDNGVSLNTLTIGDGGSASALFYDNGYTFTLAGTSVLNLQNGTYKLGTTTTATTFPDFDTLNISSGTTVNYAAGVAQTVKGINYYNLNITQASTKTLDGNMTVNGTLTVGASSLATILNLGSYNHLIVGALTVTIGATVNGGSSDIEIQGDMNGSGTFTGNTSTVTVTGTVAKTCSIVTANLYNLNVEKTGGGSFGTNTNPLNVLGDLNVTTGSFNMGGVVLTVTGATTVAPGASVTTNSTATTKNFFGGLTVNGSWVNSVNHPIQLRGGITVGPGATFTPGTGTHTFNTNNQVIGDGAAFTIQNVTVTGVNLTNNNTSGFTASTTLAGTGSFTQGPNAILNTKAATVGITTLNATSTGNTVNYSGTQAGGQTPKVTTYYNLILSGSGAKVISGAINNDLTVTDTVNGVSAVTTTVGGNLLVDASSSLQWSGPNSTVTGTTEIKGSIPTFGVGGTTVFTGNIILRSTGTWNNSNGMNVRLLGGLTVENGATFTSGTGIYTFDTNDQSIDDGKNILIPNVTVTGIKLTNNNTNGFTIGSTLSGTGEIVQGTSAQLTIGGSISIATLTATSSGNTVIYASTTADQTVKSAIYNNLTIDKSGKTATLGGNVTVNGDLLITAGTLDASTSNYSLVVKGNWTNNGTFTPRSGLVSFNASSDQTISGSTSWYGLAITASSARTVYFESGATQSVNSGGALSLVGSAGDLLTLSPLTASTSWNLRVSTSSVTQSISYVRPSFSDAGTLGTDAQIDAANGTNQDGGDNTNWNFAGDISMDFSTSTIGFGDLASTFAKYATDDGSGTTTETAAHTITVDGSGSSGYTLYVEGDAPNCPAHQISPIGTTAQSPTPGSEQFGIRLTASGGAGSVSTPYAGSDYAYGASSSTQKEIATAASSPGQTIYSVRYVANVSPSTTACDYAAGITYTLVPNF